MSRTGRILPCGRVEALHRRGAAPPGDEVLRGHAGEQQRELQRRGAREPRHDCAAVTWRRRQVDVAGARVKLYSRRQGSVKTNKQQTSYVLYF